MNKESIKKFITNEYFLLGIITVLALCIRLLNLNKPYGLWYDEALTYYFASKSFPFGILKAMMRYDYHMPLYYLYVHAWATFFGSNDLSLRCSSMIWGVFTVPAFYFLGKTFQSKKLGFLLATIACFSPVLIYYSQEMRFYALLVFLSTVSLIMFLRLIKAPTKRDFLIFGIANLIMIYIYTLGLIFIFTELLLLFINYWIYKKENLRALVLYSAIFFIFMIPYFIFLLIIIQAFDTVSVTPFMWFRFTLNISSLLTIMNDWFSPALMGLLFVYGGFFKQFFLINHHSIGFFIDMMPSVCCLIGAFYGLRKINQNLLFLFVIFVVFISAEIFLCITHDFVLVTRYTIITLPIVLLICSYGILSINKKSIKIALISGIFIAYILNVLNYKHAISFSLRYDGFKPIAMELKNLNVTKKDYVLFPIKSELLEKYYDNAHYVDIDMNGILYLDKTEKEELKMFNKYFVLATDRHNYQSQFIPYFLSPTPTPELTQTMNSEIRNMSIGSRFILVDTRCEFKKDMETIRRESFLAKINHDHKFLREWFYSFFFTKLIDDLTFILDHNPSIKKVGTVIKDSYTNPRMAVERRFIIYQKIKN